MHDEVVDTILAITWWSGGAEHLWEVGIVVAESEPIRLIETEGEAPKFVVVPDHFTRSFLAHLRPLLRYPRIAERDGQQGVALVAIGVDRQGIVRSARIVRGSGYPSLDGEALATVKRGSPLPRPTADIPGDPVSVELPIQFSLRG